VSANRFTGRRALVTGAGSGIGAAVARRLHAEGADVVLADVRAEPVEAIAGELDDRAHAVQLDVRDEDAVRAIAWEVDVLANVAGIGSTTTAPETPLAVWEDVFGQRARDVPVLQARNPRNDRPWRRVDRERCVCGRAGGAA
jgi:NAD(P)-dependent dehydrogenase (short-subunit alcohol dehydrogenase family)